MKTNKRPVEIWSIVLFWMMALLCIGAVVESVILHYSDDDLKEDNQIENVVDPDSTYNCKTKIINDK